jgi:glycosyltransferase involved in cell wall biosynthesis/2-polyprenyl-3-methyl-5-hydroxy-6-metoxy-1,4-benzoquinol methylase
MSNYKLDIVFYVNGMPFNGDALKTQSLGGSETMGLHMARELANRGHHVTMFSNCDKPKKYDKVTYRHVSEFESYMTFAQVDICIGQRIPQLFSMQTKAKLNFLWNHDLAIKRHRKDFHQPLWNIDEVWGLTDYHINQMSEIYGVSKDIFWKTRNGIEPVKLDKKITRRKKRLIYTSRPERGMDTLLKDIMPRLWKEDPDIELRIAGYDNTVKQMKPFYDSLKEQIRVYQEQGYNIKHLGALNKEDLYKEYQKATLYAYPTDFEEISCITAMECMANGLPIVGSKLAALPETLDEKCSALIEGNSKTPEYHEKFIATIQRLLKEENWQEEMRQAGIERAKEFHLSKLAEEWESHFYELFAKRVMNKEALANHFYRNEDIMALSHLIENINRESGQLDYDKWSKVLNNEYAIIHNPNAYDDLYEEYGKNFKKKFDNGELQLEVQMYPRVQVIMQNMGKPKNILDYGCAIGNEAIQFVNAFGCKVTSVNISEDEMAVGKELAEKHCKYPENITWIKARSPEEIEGEFDTIFAGEILEHLAEPQKLIDQLEAKCIKGGKLFFTVPFGPWGDTNDNLEQRGHLWSFNMSDLRTLFGQKKDFVAGMIPGGMNDKCRETMGWYYVKYEKTNAPTGIIDLDRKLAIQVPRQTLSACMIVGGKQEGLLYRCLDSIVNVADEIIIADTGMSTSSLRILQDEKYKGKITLIPNVESPLSSGFDTARNESIKHAKGDWILWIDSDEELLTPEKILKFLKNNPYNGYSIRQHHFSAQPSNAFKADLPVRLFRNHKGIKFFGVVHEHPEKTINVGVGASTIIGDVDIAHDGYLTEDGRRKRFDRNYRLLLADREKYPERMLGKFLIMRDWCHIVRYNMERNGGQITSEIVDYCNKVIKMYKNEFLGKQSMMSSDGLGYYSEALTVLGQGLEYSFNIDIKPQQSYLNGGDITARFADKEDFMKYLTHTINSQTEPFQGKYV